MKENLLKNKSFAFALRCVKCYGYLQGTKNEWVLSKQLLRSGTSIGANIREAEHAESKADFVHKLTIALKETNETAYWLELLHQSTFLEADQYDSIYTDCIELLKMLTAIVKTNKNNG